MWRGGGVLRRCAATPYPPPSGAPVSLRVGRSADLTRHRRVIQRREPLKGKANGGVSFNTATHRGEGVGVRRQEQKTPTVAEASGRVSLRAGERRHSPFIRQRRQKALPARIRGKSQLSIAREGFLDRRSKRCFWLLLSPQTKVARAGARNYPRRRQIMRLRRCAATPHPSRLRRATCLPADRSVRGSDTPPACHSTARSPQGEGLAPAGGCSKKVHGFPAKLKGRIKESEYAIKQKER